MEIHFFSFALYTLNDENGISQEAYDALGTAATLVGNPRTTGMWAKLFSEVEATDGRFYISQEANDRLVDQFLG